MKCQPYKYAITAIALFNRNHHSRISHYRQPTFRRPESMIGPSRLLPPGRLFYGGMTHVASLKFQGGRKKLLEILYNVMQRPISKELIAVSCCDNPTERGYFCQMITYRTSSIHSATCTFNWNLKLTTSSQKTWIIKVLIFMSKML